MENPNIRRAVVKSDLNRKPELEKIAAYLPHNYSVEWVGDELIISGHDDHGWTLDG